MSVKESKRSSVAEGKDKEQLDLPGATVWYMKNFLDKNEADALFSLLRDLAGWDYHSVTVPSRRARDYIESTDGTLIQPKEITYVLGRKTIVFADDDIIEKYKDKIPKIWGKCVVLLPWPPYLRKVRDDVERKTGKYCNICLGNSYEDGDDYIALHADNEEQGDRNCVVSISLGAERPFRFKEQRNKKKENSEEKARKVDMTLHHGSLLYMGPGTQENYLHSLLKVNGLKEPRINLTFRIFHYEDTAEESLKMIHAYERTHLAIAYVNRSVPTAVPNTGNAVILTGCALAVAVATAIFVKRMKR